MVPFSCPLESQQDSETENHGGARGSMLTLKASEPPTLDKSACHNNHEKGDGVVDFIIVPPTHFHFISIDSLFSLPWTCKELKEQCVGGRSL